MTTAEPEGRFFIITRITTFVRSAVSEERLSALAMLRAGKKLLESNNFNKKATEAFVLREERRMDFTYKDYTYGFSPIVNELCINMFLFNPLKTKLV
jgi:hypothetical protein